MKLFSLISSVATFAMLQTSGFCESAQDVISHRSSGNGGYSSSQNMNYGSQNGSMDDQVYPKMYLQSARGCHSENGPYFDVEFLWVRPVEDGLDYGWEVTNPTVQTGSSARNIKVYGQDFSYEPGFRVGLGYNFGFDKWDVYANYTWLYSYNSDSVNGEVVGTHRTIVGLQSLIPINNGSLQYTTFENARSLWQLQFNAWDLDLGRNYYVGQHFSVRPTWGLKGSLIR